MSKIVDANVLINATRPQAHDHDPAKRWLDESLNSRETVYLPWTSLLAFLRVSTNPRINDVIIPTELAVQTIRVWMERPNVVVPAADALHLTRVAELLGAAGRAGDLVPDAHLAALAIQYDATVITFDSDFARFPGVRWERPSAS